MNKISSHTWALACCLALGCAAQAQVLYQDQVIEVRDLPSLAARSLRSSDVLLTSLDIIIHDRGICCGKDSALEDSVAAADPKSLKDVADKVQGRHLLSDGRPIIVGATYAASDAVNSGMLITRFQGQHAALMQWNSHIYVVHGIVYMWTANATPDGSLQDGTVIKKFLLWDVRYSDSRRDVVFNRDSDDLTRIQGFLFVETKPQ